MLVHRLASWVLIALIVVVGVSAGGTRGGRRVGRSKAGDDDPWMTDSDSEDNEEVTEVPTGMPATVATVGPVVGGPGPGPATAPPVTPGVATAAPRIWTPSEGGSRPLVTMRLPRWTREDTGGLSDARYWANFKTGFGDDVSTDGHVFDARFIKFVLALMVTGAGIWRCIQKDAIDRECVFRQNVAEQRLADRIDQQRDAHFRDCARKGFTLTVADDSWRPIGSSIRERGMQRILEEMAAFRAEMEEALAVFINGDGSRKRRRLEDNANGSQNNNGSDGGDTEDDGAAGV